MTKQQQEQIIEVFNNFNKRYIKKPLSVPDEFENGFGYDYLTVGIYTKQPMQVEQPYFHIHNINGAYELKVVLPISKKLHSSLNKLTNELQLLLDTFNND